MRIRLSIDDALFAAAQRRARDRGLTLGQLVEEALRAELVRGSVVDGAEIPVFGGGDGVCPGVDMTSNRALIEALDEGLALEHFR